MQIKGGQTFTDDSGALRVRQKLLGNHDNLNGNGIQRKQKNTWGQRRKLCVSLGIKKNNICKFPNESPKNNDNIFSVASLPKPVYAIKS